jgi:Asp-tRNA(Asn)/Glu-tRNA(Gln) amidotransferase A subunit family amidase
MDQVELARAFRTAELPISDYISQLESYFFSREPSVLAFVPEENRFGRLHTEAEALQAHFPDPENRPPLFGVLVGLKDIIHVGGFSTQAGSRLPAKELQGAEAECATKLKKAGALILGKTVTTEFAFFSPGPTRNPHNPEHTPGGSSSGSAAAVGAGLCSLTLGTQTIGSIIRPAAFCGAVALKPTYDRISRDGVIPLSPSLDTIGFFTPDIATVKLAAPALCNRWNDTIPLNRKPTLGIPEGPYLDFASDYTLACFRSICGSLAEAGYEIHRIPVMDDYPQIRARHDIIMAAEVARVHKTWFEKYADLYSSKLTDFIRQGQSITDAQLQNALMAREDFRAEIRRTMIDNNIDLWIAPSAVDVAPKGLDTTGYPALNLPWTQAGLPVVSLPAGKNPDGLPYGLQVIGNWYKDESLLIWAEAIEKVLADR